MKYSEIKLLLSTYSYCLDKVNCNECPWIKNKGECNFDEDEWSLKLHKACSELLKTVEDLHVDIPELQQNYFRLEQENKELTEENKELIEENKNLSLGNDTYKLRLEEYNEIMEERRRVILAQREVGRQQALEIYHKDVRIAKLNARLKALVSEEEEAW